MEIFGFVTDYLNHRQDQLPEIYNPTDLEKSALVCASSYIDNFTISLRQHLQQSQNPQQSVMYFQNLLSEQNRILGLVQSELAIRQIQTKFRVWVLDQLENLIDSAVIQIYQAGFLQSTDWSLTRILANLNWTDVIQRNLRKSVKLIISTQVGNPNVTTGIIQNITQWYNDKLTAWINQIFNVQNSELIQEYNVYCYKLVAKTRINQMFDIILDYPDTMQSIQDIKDCFTYIDLSRFFEITVKSDLTKRMVDPSKTTEGILFVYVNLTKVMKQLFNTIEILESIAEPLKKELRKRPDTFQCIIKNIQQDQELYSLLEVKQKSIIEHEDFSSDEDERAASEWQPIPRTAVKSAISALNKRSDIVSMLINIYGSQEQFMDEYRKFLSQKLFHNQSYDVSDEIRELERLKKRFGEANVQKCEVMLYDVKDSMRINNQVHEIKDQQRFENIENLNCLVISNYCWPIEDTDYKFDLPEHLRQPFELYTERYQQIKVQRKLKFHEQLGQVSLNMQFEDGTVEFENLLPIQAAIISLFNDSITYRSSQELASSLGICQSLFRKHIAFWESNNVLERIKQDNEYYYRPVKQCPNNT